MELHELKFSPGAKKARKRVGRGTGSGHGKTSGRGHKGQKARSGFSMRTGFEGGQMPLIRRLPKVGFTSPFPKVFALVNVGDLNGFADGAEITPEKLIEAGLIKKKVGSGVKVLARGKLERRLEVRAHRFSAAARKAIEEAGGTCHVLPSGPGAESPPKA